MPPSYECALFASGRGSNALNLIESMQRDPAICFRPRLLISDRPQAPILEKARALGVSGLEVCTLDPKEFETRAAYDRALAQKALSHGVQWVFLAGFMRILSNEFLSSFYDPQLGRNRVLNIHPSLLPKYPGLNAYQKAYASEDRESGITVHFVDDGVDTGEILLQQSYPKIVGESFESFESRGLELEHKIYPEALKKLSAASIGQ